MGGVRKASSQAKDQSSRPAQTIFCYTSVLDLRFFVSFGSSDEIRKIIFNQFEFRFTRTSPKIIILTETLVY